MSEFNREDHLYVSTYRYKEPPQRGQTLPTGPLPESDYDFVVASCGEPYESKANNLVLPLELTIKPHDVRVFANPWTGQTSAGEERDGIAEFLLCINRAPKVGEEPKWQTLVGARGRCRLKVEIAQMGALAGSPVNKVAWFHVPKQIDTGRAQVAAVQAQVKAKVNPSEDPDEIPF
jgi:hypothetical protein